VQSVADLQHRLIGEDRLITALFSTVPAPVNSDFFPFVDLNAPRMRFLRRDANELPGLTLLSIPLLDLLRNGSSDGPTLEPLRQSTLARDARVRRALAIRQALLSGRLEGLDGPSAVNVMLLHTTAVQCADPQAQAAWKTAVRVVSAMTSSYLTAAELADVWSGVRSTPCYRDASGAHKVWTDLLAAVAARNVAEMVKISASLLETDASLSKDERTYLTTVLATGYVRLGQLPQARELLVSHWNQLDHAGEFALTLSELLALAADGQLTVAGDRSYDANAHRF
jgi:hypothetical protein